VPLLGAATLIVGYMLWRFPLGAAPCAPARDAVVVVDTSAHVLTLCEGGSAIAWYSVRVGKHGPGKTREGDGKTPLGRYALGEPYPSASYGTFVPIGYPRDDQRAEGYTGSAVGIHGPTRGIRFLGPLANAVDTTDGCVGLWSDAHTTAVARFVREHRGATIELR
jgi:hypothetical protein